MIKLAALSLLALLASVGLTLSGAGSPAAAAHLLFAVGIVPLIFGAITHFVGVLTRTGEAAAGIRALPFVAQGAGLVVVAAMLSVLPRWSLHAAAVMELALCLTLLAWVIGRARACIGSPHPGWRWYAAALSCFALALMLVLLAALFPALYLPFRLAHLHLNTLGFIGCAAFGTLPLLLPTALAQADSSAAHWLRQAFLPMLAAVLLISIGAGLSIREPSLAIAASGLGATIQAAVAFSLLWRWSQNFSARVLWRDGITASLVLAVIGYLGLLGAGLAHGVALLPAGPSVLAWACGFLLPLVTGALSQLLPVWRWPGPRLPRNASLRASMARNGQWRALCFLVCSACFVAGWNAAGAIILLTGIAIFLAALAGALRS